MSKRKRTARPDFIVENHGTIILIEPVSDAAREFVSESVSIEPWQWMGASFACDRRMALGLIDDLTNEYGFVVDGRLARAS